MKTITTDRIRQGATIHAFEAAGLGNAPFKYKGFKDMGKVQGSCDFCGTGIRLFCFVESSDGKQFKVGSDCVEKVGDHGLRKAVSQALAKYRAEKNRLNRILKKEELKALLREPIIMQMLSKMPHPNQYFASKGKTRLDYAMWVATNAGNAAVSSLVKELAGHLATAK